MSVVAGYCGKCGAPYFWPEDTWGGVCPPPVRPTCACWNLPVTITATSFTLNEYGCGRIEERTGGTYRCIGGHRIPSSGSSGEVCRMEREP